jgi:hypothetical protein
MPPETPEPRTAKARGIWSLLDRVDATSGREATLAEITRTLHVDPHTAIRQRKAWREMRKVKGAKPDDVGELATGGVA